MFIMIKTHNKQHAAKPGAWFVSVRGSYLPSSVKGWITYIPFSAYLLLTLYLGIEESRSVVMAILFVVPNWIAATAIMSYLAYRKS